MSNPTLDDLQESVKDRSAFENIDHYYAIGNAFLNVVQNIKPTRIVSPNDHRYIFYQYGKDHNHKITRPLNSDLFFESQDDFQRAFDRFATFLDDIRQYQDLTKNRPGIQAYLSTNEVNKIVYTVQQSIGSIGDSFDNPNQSRKRVGQLFEKLILLIMRQIGFRCESRKIIVPIPTHPDYTMSYELDLVFSRKNALITAESEYIHPDEVVGSVKTTSKDRIDKIFLDKYLLSKLLGRDIKVVAIFLHDVQRARRARSIFGVNSTFKTNHFLGYTLALNRMNGVYYVDPRPKMITDPRLSGEINDFQHFLTHDVWNL